MCPPSSPMHVRPPLMRVRPVRPPAHFLHTATNARTVGNTAVSVFLPLYRTILDRIHCDAS